MQLPSLLCKVELHVSCVCPASGPAIWAVLREFGKWGDFFQVFDDRIVQSTLVLGSQELQVGAHRILQIGAGKVVEQLTGLNDEKRSMSYKLVTHSSNINPYSASFVNYTCRVRTRPVSMTKQTFVEMNISFMTEHSALEAMQSSLTYFHESCLQCLCNYLSNNHRGPLGPARSLPQVGMSSKPVGSFDLYNSLPPAIGRQTSFQAAENMYQHHADRQNSSDSTQFDSPKVLL